MPRNTLLDVHNILVEQLERLMDAETPQELEIESKRAKAVSSTSKAIIGNAAVILKSQKLVLEYGEASSNDEANKILIGE